jgi:hypothetical protein
MKHTVTLVLTLALALAGCGIRGYAKPGATRQEFMQNYVLCENGANPVPMSGLAFALGGGGPALIIEQGRTNRCMEALGWEIRRGDDVYHP